VRGEVELKEQAIANLNSEIKTLVGENKTLVADLLECRPALESVRDELKEREQAIANLKAELEVRENKQLTLFPGPEPTPEPEPIPTPNPTPEIVKPESTTEPKTKSKVKSKPKNTPEPEPEPIPLILLDTIEGTVPRKVIMDRILEIDPATEINGQIITDAVLGNNQRLSELETTYGFKFVGYVMRGKNREYRYKLS
jgi:outer membrane biosynthesis protein TonB